MTEFTQVLRMYCSDDAPLLYGLSSVILRDKKFMKVKNYYMLIFYWKMLISFVNGAKLPKDLPCLKISICLRIFGGFFLEKRIGGCEKVEIFFYFLSLVICKKS